MQYCCAVVLASIFLPTIAVAGDSRIERGPIPAWVHPSELLPVPDSPTGAIFIRRQDVVARIDGQGQSQFSGYRTKLLNASALQAGNISISWNPSSEVATVHDIRVYRDGVATDVLAKSDFEILRREDQLEQARLDGVLTAILHVPDLRVGDELEVDLTIVAKEPTFGDDGAGLLLMGGSPGPGRYRLGLTWDEAHVPRTKFSPDLAGIVERGTQAIDLRFDNPGQLTPPARAPARYAWQRVVEFTTFPDWPTISHRYAPIFARAAKLAPDSPLRQEAARIAAAHPLPLDRAAAALNLVQQDVRYIYVGLNGGNLIPASADETWQRRYGDCKAKTALLLALLGEMGIEAQAVLVNTSGKDDGMDERLPSPRLFDHVVVRATIAGQRYWLDGTMPPVVGPDTEPALPFAWVLPLSDNGSALEHLAWHPARRPADVTLLDIDASAGFDQPARVTNTEILRGLKGLQQQVQLSSLSQDQLVGQLREAIVGAVWQSVDDAHWHYDQKTQASVLSITGTWKLDWDDDGKGARSMALPGGGFNPPERRVRAAGQNAAAPFANEPRYDCDVTTLRLPASTKPANWSHSGGFDQHIFGMNYYRAVELRGDTIRMVRGLRVERNELDAVAARAQNGLLDSFDNSKAMVYYDPRGHAAKVSEGRVPSAGELDWTVDDSACLSPAARGH